MIYKRLEKIAEFICVTAVAVGVLAFIVCAAITALSFTALLITGARAL